MQVQRQLQLSLEAHGRYMVSLMDSELAPAYSMDQAMHGSTFSSACLRGPPRTATTSAPAALPGSGPGQATEAQPPRPPSQQQQAEQQQPQRRQLRGYDAFAFDEPEEGELRARDAARAGGVAEWTGHQTEEAQGWPNRGAQELGGLGGGDGQEWPFVSRPPGDGHLSPGRGAIERGSGEGLRGDDADILLHLHDDNDPLDFPEL
jgi:hypothetical protein